MRPSPKHYIVSVKFYILHNAIETVSSKRNFGYKIGLVAAWTNCTSLLHNALFCYFMLIKAKAEPSPL